MAKVDVVIVNWNSGIQLKECIASLWEFGGKWINQIIVVDNGSTDGSVDLCPKSEPNLKIIFANKNLGFAKACNLGAKDSKAEFLLFFNPDAKLMEGTLEKVINVMTSKDGQRIGICGTKIVDENGNIQRECARFPTWKTYFSKAFVLDKIFPSLFPSLWLLEFDHLTNAEVDHVMGCFFFIRTFLFHQLGGYDERFFVYLEDLDLSLKVNKAGYKTLYFADASIFHKGGGVSEQIKARRLFYSLRSRLLYVYKHFSILQAIFVTFCINVEFMPRLIRAIFRLSLQEFFDTFCAYLMLWSDFPKILQTHKRHEKKSQFAGENN